jgi:hypothetical protein
MNNKPIYKTGNINMKAHKKFIKKKEKNFIQRKEKNFIQILLYKLKLI